MISDDLRAGVQAGILTEAQAASLSTLITARAGQRAAMPAEDEPFEFFKGFSEIFISIGLIILLSGSLSLIAWAGGATIAIVLPLIAAGIAWWWAEYFTLRRRMNLPSMVLALVFGGGLLIAVTTLVLQSAGQPSRFVLMLPPLVATLGMAAWYRRFRLPFSMFVLGGFALLTLYALTTSTEALIGLAIGTRSGGMNGLFDLRESPAFAFATLGFGIVAFLAGMWFDMRDPHRLGRNAATAFWLHLLAAFALVNTVAVTLYGSGGMVLLLIALLIITGLALVIDRRSFVSAAIGYMAFVIVWATGGGDFGSWAFALLLLGALITAIGTWWVQLRGWLMRTLPDFPGKDRLPPYARPEV
ncbi:hypothetical protein M3484_14175 [Pseudomonas sp. GX19020]|uniref:hypothetical protein n=1 Tax=Pseudomonas sp. GX19020 TaxID=2942277 RepID=UPI0020190984|nr:hypothetical protein [Pseudomonas sp. GX19020]MCL4067721.1 hypothetical protein [Pseudomonas sp. GX19020]